jgi:hypothetical protein
VGDGVVAEVARVHEHQFELVVGTDLPNCHEHRSPGCD